jgi:hypothetical protein
MRSIHGVLCSLCYDVSTSNYIALNCTLDDESENNVAGHNHSLTEVLSCYFPEKTGENLSQDTQ